MHKVKCNNCEWQGTEEELVLVEYDSTDENETPITVDNNIAVEVLSPRPQKVDYLKGCPKCLTDHYLMDIKQTKAERKKEIRSKIKEWKNVIEEHRKVGSTLPEMKINELKVELNNL